MVPFQTGCFLQAFFCWESALVTYDAHGGCGCREKDMLKALAQQERQSTRSRHRDAHAGPRDDLDLEMDALVLKQQQSNPGCAPLTILRCRCSCACACHEHSHCLSLAVGKRRQMHGNSKRAARPQVAGSNAERIVPKRFQPPLQGFLGRGHSPASA